MPTAIYTPGSPGGALTIINIGLSSSSKRLKRISTGYSLKPLWKPPRSCQHVGVIMGHHVISFKYKEEGSAKKSDQEDHNKHIDGMRQKTQ